MNERKITSLESHPKKKSFIEIIKTLYDLFIEPENPNNPRNKRLLTGFVYSLRFLSLKIGISEEDLYELFQNVSGCKLVFNESKKITELVISDRDQFKKYIENKYLEILQRKKDNRTKKSEHPPFLKEFSEVEQTKNSIGPIEKDSYPLNPSEIEYLKLILKYNPSGEFSISKPNIPSEVFKKRSDLKLIKSQRFSLIEKCVGLGLIEGTSKGKCKFVVDFLKLF